MVHRLPVNRDGRVAADTVPTGLIGLGTLILAQNETGTIQPVAEIAERMRRALAIPFGLVGRSAVERRSRRGD